MELRQLRYFSVVARERHFGKAARVLNIAQPALSRQIQKLEEELGKVLFVRHARGVSLTPDATLFFNGIVRILADLREVTDDISNSETIPRGKVTIGLSSAAADILGAPLIQRIARAFPEVRLGFRTAHASTRLELVLERRVDMVIVDLVHAAPGFSIKPLLREPWCILCRADDRRFTKPSVQLRDLVGIPLVNGFTDTSPRRALDEALAREGLSANPIVEVDAFSTSKRLMLAGHAPTVNAAALVAAELKTGQVRAIPIEGLYMTRTLAIPDDRPTSTAVRLVSDEIVATTREMIRTGQWPFAEELDETGKVVAPPQARRQR